MRYFLYTIVYNERDIYNTQTHIHACLLLLEVEA